MYCVTNQTKLGIALLFQKSWYGFKILLSCFLSVRFFICWLNFVEMAFPSLSSKHPKTAWQRNKALFPTENSNCVFLLRKLTNNRHNVSQHVTNRQQVQTSLEGKKNKWTIRAVLNWLPKSNWFYISTLPDFLKILAPIFLSNHNLKSTTKIKKNPLANVFPYFVSATLQQYSVLFFSKRAR